LRPQPIRSDNPEISRQLKHLYAELSPMLGLRDDWDAMWHQASREAAHALGETERQHNGTRRLD
jgi:hypothetical protein